jgi:hypothetical protein
MPQGRPWERYGAQPQQPAPPAVIYGPPKQLDPVEAERLELSRRADARAERADARDAARVEMGKSLPETAAKRYEDSVSIYARLKSAQGGFQDEYAGNTFTGGLENWAQSLNSNLGTPGQRQWWADFTTLDNQIRNELFGATLTPSEQAAYARTTIGPQMDPKIIRENLREREEIVRKALQRRTDFLKKSGYNAEAIDALAGEYAPEVQPGYRASPEPVGDVAPDAMSLTVDNVADVLTGLSGGQYSIERDGLYYTANGERKPVNLAEGLANSPEYREAYREKFGELPPLQVDVVGGQRGDAGGSDEYLTNRGLAGWDAALAGGIADTLTLGASDEIAAAGATLFNDRTMRDNLGRARAQDRYDETNYPAARLGGQALGALVPFGRAAGVGRSVALPRSAWKAGAEGAALGGAYGFNSAEGDIQERAKGALTGGVIGGGVGTLFGAAANRFNRPPGGPTPPPTGDVMQAAQRQRVDILPADAGGALTRGATAIARQGWISEAPITRAAERAAAQGGAARDRAAAAAGRALDKDDAGEIVRRAANVYAKETGKTGEALYDRAFRLAGNARVVPQKAIARLDEHIAELSETPGGSGLLNEFKALRDNLASGNFSIRGVRNMRTRLREEMDLRGLRGSDTDRRLKDVYQSAAEDMADALAQSGNDRAAQAFRTADKFWRKRVETIDDVLDPLIGKNSQRSGEHILSTLERMANKETGDAARLRRLMRALPQGEANSVRATVIQRLGQPKPGRQVEGDQDFSFADFLTRWNGMSSKAKRVLFPEQSVGALNDLATIARGARRTAAYANSSNTARALIGQAAFSAIVGGAADLMTAGKVAGAQFVMGKLLASPTFARFLARTPKMDIQAASKALDQVARRDPAIAQDALGLQRYLQQAISSAPTRAAAEEERE